MRLKRTFGIIVFLLIFAALFFEADRLLVRKSTEGWWNTTAKIDGFYNSDEDEYDVMFFGSSNAYCSFNPLVLWDKTGVKSYVFATQQQPVWATYHYMVDAIKRQSPDLAVVDILMFSNDSEYYDDGVNYTFCDNMPLSKNKLELIAASAPAKERFGLLCRFFKYHSRWDELSRTDFEYKRRNMHDYSMGYCVLTETCDDAVYNDTSNVSAKSELSEKNAKYLNKIIELCRESNTELILVKTPSNETAEEKTYYNAVEQIAADAGVSFCDYNAYYKEIGLNLKTDFYDQTHLNTRGAEKFTEYFAAETPYFDGKTRTDTSWDANLEKYRNAAL